MENSIDRELITCGNRLSHHFAFQPRLVPALRFPHCHCQHIAMTRAANSNLIVFAELELDRFCRTRSCNSSSCLVTKSFPAWIFIVKVDSSLKVFSHFSSGYFSVRPSPFQSTSLFFCQHLSFYNFAFTKTVFQQSSHCWSGQFNTTDVY